MAEKIEAGKHEARHHEHRPTDRDEQRSGVGETVREYGSGMMAGVSNFEHGAMDFVRDTATDGVHVTRDVATELVRGVGDVAETTVKTAGEVLVGVAQGVRDVAGTLFGRRGEPRA